MPPESQALVSEGGTVAELLSALADCVAAGRAAVLATVIARRGSTPSTPGQKIALLDDGRCLGTLGGGAIEHAIQGLLVERLERARGGEAGVSQRSYALTQSLGMCCGGSVEVLVESFAASRTVGIVGAGHIATALAPLLAGLGFAVHVADDRDAFAEAERISAATMHLGPWTVLDAVLPQTSALLVMTHDHALDQSAIEWGLRRGYAFVGGVGSRAKAIKCRARLEGRGIAAHDVARVRMPVGLAIGARSPQEIAVSIAAELVAWRSGCDHEAR